ncbi:MAG: 50S ribosomal protein L24, partial [Candidatus Paceibacterota bacterium]
MKIKKGDNVIVIAGKDRGKQAKVLRVLHTTDQVLVEGVNLKKKHQRPRREGEKGQMIDMPHPVHLSNVLLYCPSCGQGVRMGAKITAKKKVRV